jgi:hypothetical protein
LSSSFGIIIKKTFHISLLFPEGGEIDVSDMENVIKDVERERTSREQLEREKSFPSHGEHF